MNRTHDASLSGSRGAFPVAQGVDPQSPGTVGTAVGRSIEAHQEGCARNPSLPGTDVR